MARNQPASESASQYEFNAAARNWARRRAYSARKAARLMFLRGKSSQARIYPSQQNEPHLARSVSFKLKKDYGIVQRVSFKFPRQGIYAELGVGRGAPAGSGGRKRKPWLSREIDDNLTELADALGEYHAHNLTRQARAWLNPKIKRK